MALKRMRGQADRLTPRVERVANGLVAHLSTEDPRTGVVSPQYVASTPEEMKEVLSEQLEVLVDEILGISPTKRAINALLGDDCCL